MAETAQAQSDDQHHGRIERAHQRSLFKIVRQRRGPAADTFDNDDIGLAPDIVVSVDEAFAVTRELCAKGFPVGPSSGLNVAGARRMAATLGPGTNVATLLCDRVERYFSTPLFDDLRAATS